MRHVRDTIRGMALVVGAWVAIAAIILMLSFGLDLIPLPAIDSRPLGFIIAGGLAVLSLLYLRDR